MPVSLSGTWIGTTREDDVMHVWRVVQHDDTVFIYARVEDNPTEDYFSGSVTAEAVLLNGNLGARVIMDDTTLIDAEHFVLKGWHDQRDMLFSREGLAELMTAAAWLRYDRIQKMNGCVDE